MQFSHYQLFECKNRGINNRTMFGYEQRVCGFGRAGKNKPYLSVTNLIVLPS